MTGRTFGEALRNEQDAAQRVLACVTVQNQIVAQAVDGQRTFAIGPPRDAYLRLRHSAVPLLGMSYTFTVIDSGHRGDERWRPVVLRCFFSFRDADEREIIAFHWHPDVPGRPEPHLHLGPASEASTLLRQAHIPASTITLAEVLRFAIREFGVEPIRRDWEARLAGSVASP